MSGVTQPAFLGVTEHTVDAISRSAIRLRYVRREGSEAVLENTGAVNVDLYGQETGGDARTLLSGEAITIKTDGIRGARFAPEAPLCWAIAASGTGTLIVREQ